MALPSYYMLAPLSWHRARINRVNDCITAKIAANRRE
jgi:hypothetical protein